MRLGILYNQQNLENCVKMCGFLSVICQVKIGHFLTFNDSPITPNEKPENYILSLHLFD